MSGLSIEALTVGPLQMNAYLVTAGDGAAALVDPGDEPDRLLAAVEARGARLDHLVCTHGHFDHVAAAAAVQERCGLPLRCHAADVPIIEAMPEIQAGYGFPPSPVPRLDPSLADGGTLVLGGVELGIVHVPGHSPGHVALVGDGAALVGDVIFAGSIGRTDLPGGDFATLAASIRERIYTLPDATILHPGHGPDTSVGREKVSNPFVTA
jgi:glyoxylase-like metal-dependent hydrolase (beta-lactamase superfamily II)